MGWSTSSRGRRKFSSQAGNAGRIRQALTRLHGRGGGFTLIELLITAFLIGTVVTGLFGLFVLSLRTAQESGRRIVAVALANEKAEMIRNLPYLDVGTTGGIPAGNIPQEEQVIQNDLTYTVKTDIRYIDDPFDGTAGSVPTDLLNTDYKQARVEVSWNSPTSSTPVLLITIIAPAGIEGGEAAGTLVFQALDVAGQVVAGAPVKLTNDTLNPAININTTTDSQGQVIIPGLPVAADSYKLSVSKANYTSEQTYDSSASLIPDASHSHLSSIEGAITNKTFFIDKVSSLNIKTQDEATVAVGGVVYNLRGTKTIGTDQSTAPVYVLDDQASTDGGGLANYSDMVWDSYDFSIDGAVTGYDIKETSVLLPVIVNPDQTVDLTVTLAPYTALSLHVTVATTDGNPIDNATVHLTGPSTDVTTGTGIVGQVFFADLPLVGSYTLAVSAPGFVDATQAVTVDGSNRIRIELVPST